MVTSTIATEAMDLRVGNLYEDRERYRNYPPFQRDKVWSLHKKQGFIDSLLRKLPTIAMLIMEDTDQEGLRIFQVIDGQQRLETILTFKENQFSTMSEKEARGRLYQLSPIEPGRTYGELSAESRNRLDDYKLHFTTFAKTDEDVLEEIFLRTNEQEALSIGEKLFIHNSKARHTALSLLDHPFWSTVYTGHTLRKEAFQAAIMCVCIELLSFPLNLRVYGDEKAPINRLILGDFDSELTDTFRNTVWKHLSEAERVFYKAQIASKQDVIPAYEACLLLGELGYNLLASKQGCLTDWYNQAKRGTINERLQKRIRFRQMEFLIVQKTFWEIHAEPLQRVSGLVKEN